MVMRPKEKGGWGRGVAYIDTEGSFVLDRFKYLVRYYTYIIDNLIDYWLDFNSKSSRN